MKCCQETDSLVNYIGAKALALLFLAAGESFTFPPESSLTWNLLRAEVSAGSGGIEAALFVALSKGNQNLIERSFHTKNAMKLAQDLLQRTRIQGPTAYISNSGGAGHEASATVQGLTLMLWAGIKGFKSHPFASALAAHVVDKTSPWQRFTASDSFIFALLGLLAMDKATGSARGAYLPISMILSAKSPGQKTLLSGNLEGNKLMLERSFDWKDLPSFAKVRPLTTTVGPGNGSAIIYLGIDFLLAETSFHAQFRGVLVQKVLQTPDPLIPGHCKGKGVTKAHSGEIICITIQVTSPDDLQDVTVIDYSPSGLEPDVSSPRQLGVADDWWWLQPARREILRDAVVWHVPYLGAGVHTFSYTATANVPGAYVIPRTKAFVSDRPEIMGLSSGGLFTVEGQKDSSAALLKLWGTPEIVENAFVGGAPKPCIGECPSSGACNLATGRCDCFMAASKQMPCAELAKMGFAMEAREPTASELQISFGGNSESLIPLVDPNAESHVTTASETIFEGGEWLGKATRFMIVAFTFVVIVSLVTLARNCEVVRRIRLRYWGMRPPRRGDSWEFEEGPCVELAPHAAE